MPQRKFDAEKLSPYQQKLRDPRWQKKRLEVFERDEWACQQCFDSKSTLHVHHFYYEQGKDPWDYAMEALVTLCADCHEEETLYRPQEEQTLLRALKYTGFFHQQILEIATGFRFMAQVHIADVMANVISWVFQDEDLMRILTNLYFEHLKQHRENGTLDWLCEQMQTKRDSLG
jgi:hypothetical protein